MVVPPPASQGFVLPLALSASAVVLLSSLSLQTLSLHSQTSSRLALQRAVQRDAEHAVAMDFRQRALGANACLLAWSSQRWSESTLCPGADPAQLQAGLSGAEAWTLQEWQPLRQRLLIHWPDGGQARIDLELLR